MRDKQIEEIKAIILEDCGGDCENCEFHNKAVCYDNFIANRLYNAGYRKASAIFEEIEEEIKLALVSNHKAKRDHIEKHYYCLHAEFLSAVQGKIDALRGIEAFIAELKKKYESECKP